MSAEIQHGPSGSCRRRLKMAASLAAVLTLGACGRGGPSPGQGATSTPGEAEAAGYLRPPQVLGAVRATNGTVALSGRSGPSVRVRLSSPPPINAAFGATASDKGEWTIGTPSPAGVQVFGVAEELPGRDVQAEGYVAVLPAPGPAAVLLRAGGGAAALVRPGALKIAAIDVDSSGAAVVSGLARPGGTARLTVDGVAAGEARVNDRGRFSIILSSTLKPGDHEARVDASDQTVSVKFTIEAPRPISGLPYRGERTPSGWRVDWLTPGGGEQITLIFDAAES
jgi:hypothetical protein